MAVRILRCSFSSSVFVRMAVFLFGVIFGMLLYLSKAQSSAEKIQQIYEEMQLEQAESLQYNLLEEQFGEQEVQQMLLDKTYECSLDYINGNKLQQDHPCVIRIIQEDFLDPPPPPDTALMLDSASTADHSLGKTSAVLRLLRNRTEGFFVDYCAGDGEVLSGTLDLEIRNGWSGILVESSPTAFRNLKRKKRKSWTVPVCLSSETYPTKENYYFDSLHSVQCFPVYSVLLATNRTEIDFLNLSNLEGRELDIMKTIPWHKVKIKLLIVNVFEEWSTSLTEFLEEIAGFTKFDYPLGWNNGLIFFKA